MWCRSVVYSSSCTTTPISPWKGARSSADKKKTWVIDLIECSRFRKFQEILFNTRKCWQENMWIIICVPIFWKYWSICEMLKEKTYRNWAWKWQFHFKVIFFENSFWHSKQLGPVLVQVICYVKMILFARCRLLSMKKIYEESILKRKDDFW